MEKQDFRKLLESMYELYEQGMYRIAYGILNNREQAEDAVQDSFEKLLKYLPRIDRPDSPNTRQLVLKIVRNTAIDQYRRNHRQNHWMSKQKEQEIEEEQLSKGAEKHDFSEKYQHKKQELLSLAEQQNKKKTVFRNRIIKRILQTAAVLIIVSGISFTAYATAKNNRAIQVEIKEQNIIKKLSIEVKRKKKSEEIIAVPEYLPDGYEEWDVGRYSLGGVWAEEGISIAEHNGMEEEELPYEAYEIWKTGNTKNLLVDKGEGNGYRWNMLLFDEKKGILFRYLQLILFQKKKY